jgi:glycosyltransferase involved in cell wall biosynthesis
MRGGGPFVRKQQVEFLRQNGFQVDVYTSPAVFAAGDPGPGVLEVANPSLKLGLVLKKIRRAPDELILWARAVAARIRAEAGPEDIVFLTTGGELSTPMVAHRLRVLGFRGRIILNLHDLPDCAVYEGSSADGTPFPRYEKWEAATFAACDSILANSGIMRDMIRAKYPGQAGKVDYFWFGFDTAARPVAATRKGPEAPLSIGYIGSMSPLQGPEILLRAWRGLSPEERQRIKPLYVGDVTDNPLLAQAQDVEKIGYLPREDLIRLMGERMDVAFVSLLNRRAFRPLMSTKFYENIGMGLPIMGAFPEDCEAGRVLSEYGFGWSCTYGDVEALQGILRRLIADPGEIGRCRERLAARRAEFAAENTMRRMVEAIEAVAKG